MKKSRLTVAIFSMFMFAYSVVGQDVLELDLSSIPPGKEKVLSENENKKFKTIKLINRVPLEEYKVWFETQLEMIPALELGGFSAAGKEGSTCEDLIKKIAEIEDGTIPIESESEVPKKLKEFSETIYKCQNDSLKKVFLELFEKNIEMDIQVKIGETVKIYVSRDDKVWTFVLKGKQPGIWVTTYGFGFTSQGLESSTYYSKQIPDTTAFQILKSDRADFLDLNYVPAIFFSYFPSQNFNTRFNLSVTSGLGFGLDLTVAPVVFIGGNLMYYNNIGLSAGVAFHQQNRLKDQYSKNELISLTLDKDQLHDKIYRPNIFVSINFRFGENPFKAKNESDNK